MPRRAAAIFLMLGACVSAASQQSLSDSEADTDHDGISDRVEAMLLEHFRPTFLTSQNDCSVKPALFLSGVALPTVAAEDGTIYGQVFPRKAGAAEIEVHYYHLWRRDCGELGHRLDAEHVSVLLTGGSSATGRGWQAAYWYAAAHEDTVCDASQITRASTIQAERHGPSVWISSGKHASYLEERLCHFGCGGDRCTQMQTLPLQTVVNLGEAGAPMSAIAWLSSRQWPLEQKMRRSDFSASRISMLEKLPVSDIAWINPEKRPAQAALLGANAGLGGAATGARAADTALVVANGSTSEALHTASQKTGHALVRSYSVVKHALRMDRQADQMQLGANAAAKQ